MPHMKPCGWASFTAYDELVSVCSVKVFDVPALWGDCLVALVVLLTCANVFQAVLAEQHFQTK